MKIDLHCHCEASWDCVTPLARIPDLCRARGISVQAITDHDQIWGAQQLRDMTRDSDLTVIVGEEVTTSEGELIGLFLEELIPPGMSALDTVKAIREQGGLVLLPHGFDPLKRKRLKPQALAKIADEIDIVEIFNTRVSKTAWNEAARRWAIQEGKLMSGGSDAHTARDIGSAWVKVPECEINTPASLLQALAHGEVEGKWVHPASALAYKIFDWGRHSLTSALPWMQRLPTNPVESPR